MKRYFDRELLITKTDNEDFENSTKCDYVIMLMLMAMLR